MPNYGFAIDLRKCIGCHACEAACSEKNDLPPHLAFRSVGYVESGTHPNFTRINISMACNHCDDPVCLKGCPTRAYTKFTEYGAVLQDPDICFGWGYATVSLRTKKIKGLHENDFIMASKLDRIASAAEPG